LQWLVERRDIEYPATVNTFGSKKSADHTKHDKSWVALTEAGLCLARLVCRRTGLETSLDGREVVIPESRVLDRELRVAGVIVKRFLRGAKSQIPLRGRNKTAISLPFGTVFAR